MNQEAVEKFYERDFLPILSETYGKIKAVMKQDEESIKKKWLEELDEIFQHIHKEQEEGNMEPIQTVCFVYLRTRYLEKDYRYAGKAYGKDWYAGEEYEVGNLDVSFFFSGLENTREKLQKERMKYFGKVQALDVDRLILEETKRNLYFMQSLFRKWKEDICGLDSFLRFQKTPNFRMELGEYFEPGILWYLQEEKKEPQKEKRELLRKENHSGKDYKKRNLDGLELISKEFVDTRFCGGSLRNSRWVNCAMQGADFQDAVLIHAYFLQCVLQESDWRSGDFRDTVFEECMIYQGEKMVMKNFWPDYEPLHLDECCLQGAKFIRCIMKEVDFSKADITGCVFEECTLLECTFTEEQIREQNLSVEKWKLHIKSGENIIERSEKNEKFQ